MFLSRSVFNTWISSFNFSLWWSSCCSKYSLCSCIGLLLIFLFDDKFLLMVVSRGVLSIIFFLLMYLTKFGAISFFPIHEQCGRGIPKTCFSISFIFSTTSFTLEELARLLMMKLNLFSEYSALYHLDN